ncbi:MAG: NEW3 domain-containing protein [Bacteroidales bacterium]
MLFCSCMLWQTSYAKPVSDSVILYSPYTKIAVTPGQSVNYAIDLINNSKSLISADLSFRGLPAGWDYNIKAGGYIIRQLSVLPGEKKSVTLTLIVPLQVNKGNYRFQVYAGDLAVLPLTVLVSEQGNYKTEFTAKQANMQGNTGSTFTFQCLLKNFTGDKQLYAMMADAPRGWNIVFKYNLKQVTSVEIEANNTADITIEVTPPESVEAATYRIPVTATTSSTTADLALEVVITGTYGMDLSTPAGLLSSSLTAGDQRKIELVVKNTGSAELRDIKLSANAPVNWEVSFDPKKIDRLAPGATAQVFAAVKGYKKAIAGDYVTTFEAKTPEKSSRISFRMSVKTPMIWGWMGVLVILAAFGGVYYLFRRFGRR